MNPSEQVLLDSNVPMYAAGREHAYRRPCQRILERVLADDLSALTDVQVHQEILHRYLSLGLSEQALQVSEDFQTVVPAILPVTVDDIARSRELSRQYPGLPARDLVHVAIMLNNRIRHIVSADRHFDRVAEIRRIDPAELA